MRQNEPRMLMQSLLITFSFLLVALGQPARYPWLGLLAAVGGYALFWLCTIDRPARQRFLLASLWFSAAHAVQLSWMTSYEYQGYYIFLLLALLSVWVGLQFGVLTLFLERRTLASPLSCAVMAAAWTLLEWSRLFAFTGYTFNPIGLAWSGSIYAMQSASIAGVYGLSFWTLWCNLLVLRWLLSPKNRKAAALALTVCLVPYVFGIAHYHYHQEAMARAQGETRALLVQTSQPPYIFSGDEGESPALAAFHRWDYALQLLTPHRGAKVDLVALPEGFVAFSAYDPAYPLEAVKRQFELHFGKEGLAALPEPVAPLVSKHTVFGRPTLFVSNAYWAHAIANLFQAPLVVGLDDRDRVDGEMHYYNSAYYVEPSQSSRSVRYAKRVLLPMAEYIPFEWSRGLAATYGIHSSYTPGDSPTVIHYDSLPPLALCICYEETFGNLVRENKADGAELVLNLTNDVWYPNSLLPQQHYTHARLRTVEAGIPFLRVCNTGVTVGVSSLGEETGRIGTGAKSDEKIAEARVISVPHYTYSTIYGCLGDRLVIGISCFLCAVGMRRHHRRNTWP